MWARLSHQMQAEEDGGNQSTLSHSRQLCRVDVAEWNNVCILEPFPEDTESGSTLTGLRTFRPWPSDHVTSTMKSTFLNTCLTDTFAER